MVGNSGPAKAVEAARIGVDRALILLSEGRLTEAQHCLEDALLAAPGYPDALHLLGLSALRQGNTTKALSLIKEALSTWPKHPVFHNNLGNIFLTSGEEETAKFHYLKAIEYAPGYSAAYFNLGIIFERQGNSAEAVTYYRDAIHHEPEYAEAHFNLGAALESLGDQESAASEYRRAIQISEDYAKAYYRLALIRPEVLTDEELTRMKELLAKCVSQSDEAIHLLFGIARATADRGDPDGAFILWQRGNVAKRASFDYNVSHSINYHEVIAEKFTDQLLLTLRQGGNQKERPIFVVGMPRSGTTLIEQILATHPQAGAGGELSFLRDIIRSISKTKLTDSYPECLARLTVQDIEGAANQYLARVRTRVAEPQRVVDKMPGNFLYLGLVSLMFPNARILHCIRDPIATCFSCYTHLFNAPQRFTYDLEDLAAYYRSYRRLMKYWHYLLPGQILDVEYETLVRNQESSTRNILEFCELPWDSACLSFHTTQRTVRTASAAQVRQPLYTKALKNWQPYEHHLMPFLGILRESVWRDVTER